MNKLILLRGNSGSGKTTIAKMLQKEFGHGTFLISQDVVRREMLYVRDTPGNPAVDLLRLLLEYGCENCEITILEGILNIDKYHGLFDAASGLYRDQIFAYRFELPFEETLRRHAHKPNSHEFGETEMLRWWRECDSIGTIPETKLTAELSAGEIAAIILRDIAESARP